MLYQVGCLEEGLCDGEVSFQQTKFLSWILLYSDTMLEDDYIPKGWIWTLFIRSICVMALHLWCFLQVLAHCHWAGFCTNIKITRKLDFIRERPDEDVVSIFSTFKQSNFFKALKRRQEKGKKRYHPI